jgi:hypothetical protein
MTVTPAAPAPALSGHQFPKAAAVKAETYWRHLDALRQALTREQAARHAQALAAAADGIAAALSGTPDAAPDTQRDPIAWTDIATYLTRLALALHSGEMNFGDHLGFDFGCDGTGWDDLAAAGSRTEFAAAWYPVRENLLELAAIPDEDGDGDDPRLRGFTVAQVTRAAAAVIDAPW